MPKNLTLNVFGDSYSTPNCCVAPKESFWGQCGKDLQAAQIVNYSMPGSPWSRVVHIILSQQWDFDNDYFLVGIPPIQRYTTYSDSIKCTASADVFDTNCIRIDTKNVPCLTNVLNLTFAQAFENDKKFVDAFNAEWNEIEHLTQILLLSYFFKVHNAKFLIHNLSIPFQFQDSWAAGKDIISKVAGLLECNVFSNTYYSINHRDNIEPADFRAFGWLGHHGSAGNLNYYTKVIKPLMQQLRWI